LDELRRQDAEERDIYKQQIEELNDRCSEKQDLVDKEHQKFTEFKKQIALVAVNSRSGKPILPKVKPFIEWEMNAKLR
jgi:peptidoglycan hydrolase CwlO-like protein